MPELVEPISVADAKKRLGIRNDQRDDEIAALIAAARGQIEDYSGRLLVRRSHQINGTGPFMSGPIAIDVAPVHSLVKVEWQDADGVVAEVEGSFLSAFVWPPRVFPLSGTAWPSASLGYAVTVDAGYDNAAEDESLHVPPQLMQALLLLVGHWFENHEAVVMGSAMELPLGVADICRQFRLPGV